MSIGAAKASELGDVPRRVTSGNEHYVMVEKKVPSQLLTQLALSLTVLKPLKPKMSHARTVNIHVHNAQAVNTYVSTTLECSNVLVSSLDTCTTHSVSHNRAISNHRTTPTLTLYRRASSSAYELSMCTSNTEKPPHPPLTVSPSKLVERADGQQDTRATGGENRSTDLKATPTDRTVLPPHPHAHCSSSPARSSTELAPHPPSHMNALVPTAVPFRFRH